MCGRESRLVDKVNHSRHPSLRAQGRDEYGMPVTTWCS